MIKERLLWESLAIKYFGSQDNCLGSSIGMEKIIWGGIRSFNFASYFNGYFKLTCYW